MLKAYCKRMAGRSVLINNTSMQFDDEGYCEVADVGNNRLDFELLLKKNGVTRVHVCDEDCDVPVGEEREEDTREGIDAPLLEEEPALDEELEEDEEPEEELLGEEEEEPEEDEDESDMDLDD